ncbi:MAG: acyl-ACP--UDP-N-acetylglucosamine O-acyltransferase [Pseudomonadota bacterium]
MKTFIHPSAVVEDGAVVGEGAHIGPLCHVGPKVKLGDGVKLLSHVAVVGNTDIGARTRIFPFASIGHEPQDLKYQGEDVSLSVGSDCIIREGVTMNPGTAGGGSVTKVGDRCAFLANAHVAHDCIVGNNVVFSNNVMLAGHCEVGDFAIFGGGCAVHQFVRIGHHAFIGGLAGIGGDVIPFGMPVGNRAALAGLNLVGMRRASVPRESINKVRAAYKTMFSGERPVLDIVNEMKAVETDEVLLDILNFILDAGDRSFLQPGEDRDRTGA